MSPSLKRATTMQQIRQFSDKALQLAVREVVVLLNKEAQALNNKGIYCRVVATGHDTWKELQEISLPSDRIPVSAEFNYGSIYELGSQLPSRQQEYGFSANVLFRFWHDYLHIANDLDFTYHDERKVGALHVKAGLEAGLSPLALAVLHADTVGQTEYHAMYGDFPSSNQYLIESYLRHGVMATIRSGVKF